MTYAEKRKALAVMQMTKAVGKPIEAAFMTKTAPTNRRQRRQARAAARKAGF